MSQGHALVIDELAIGRGCPGEDSPPRGRLAGVSGQLGTDQALGHGQMGAGRQGQVHADHPTVELAHVGELGNGLAVQVHDISVA